MRGYSMQTRRRWRRFHGSFCVAFVILGVGDLALVVRDVISKHVTGSTFLVGLASGVVTTFLRGAFAEYRENREDVA